MPNLVFAVEAWERQLVLAGRMAKVDTVCRVHDKGATAVRAAEAVFYFIAPCRQGCMARVGALGLQMKHIHASLAYCAFLWGPAPAQVNLMRDAKRSTNRDFKLKISVGAEEGSGRWVGYATVQREQLYVVC